MMVMAELECHSPPVNERGIVVIWLVVVAGASVILPVYVVETALLVARSLIKPQARVFSGKIISVASDRCLTVRIEGMYLR